MTGEIVQSHEGVRYRRTGKVGKFVQLVMDFTKDAIEQGILPLKEDIGFIGTRICNVWTMSDFTARAAMEKGGLQYLDGWAADAEVELLMPLPRIPNWPLPGPAPQYLSDDPNSRASPGDWTCYIFRHPTDGGIRVQFNQETFDSQGLLKFRMRGAKDCRIYLIAARGEVGDFCPGCGKDLAGAATHRCARRNQGDDSSTIEGGPKR